MLGLVRSAFLNRRILWQLIKRDLFAAHHGSVLGALWVLIDPLAYIALALCFFQFAVKGGEDAGVSYVAWVLPLIVLWTFVSAAISSATAMVREYSFLLRHRNFDMRLVAWIKVSSAALVHFVLLAVVLIFLIVHSRLPVGWPMLALVYYFFAICAFITAVDWIISALGVFWKDVRGIVSILLQVGFWISPIFWEPSRFPAPVAFVMYANPLFYPMNGYRKSIIMADFGVSFWGFTFYYWAVIGVLLYFGSRLFNRLSRSFGDVL
ncbi:ABC transporter permease [Bradyrhizobium sp. CB1650]|uniref:ABC transporter permease n=1 Tax=Bradyrhizobium sp. CB1650 TaxID=3039153 RepID=UPI00243596C3|nr:ABC transporter permease [Bradyrhizobium sp. CB1650]WGD55357.1 ABC transporter permease [Bradyrhizobium sp. CB1650]